MATDALDRRVLLGALGGAAGIAVMSKIAQGGPLNPPAGPIAPTGKTVQEIYDKIARTDLGLAEARIPVQSLPGSPTATHVISQSGSYYLTGNILGVAGKNGIEITADDVSLDLCGYSMIGGGSSLSGVLATSATASLRLCDGKLTGWGQRGVHTQALRAAVLCDLIGANNGDDGFFLGNNHVCRNCIAVGNGHFGFVSQENASYFGCAARQNGFGGFDAAFGSCVESCVAENNSFEGIRAAFESRIANCEFSFNGTAGINVSSNCLVEHNMCTGNQTGIRVEGSAVRVDSNNCVGGGTGILATSGGNLFLRNSSRAAPTAFNFASGNAYGPIVNVAGVGDIGGVTNANHPWANFIY
ncbi:MAG: right-handed parallel beta-helix repeat-containing protein [Phycisphaerales bacterium]|nr:right-handed parallel beta-helix repeat-containing protein [Phycisphaerales bacterium]